MMLHVRIAGDGRPEFLVEGEPWLRGMGLRIPNGCGWLGDGSGDLTGGSWTSFSGEDAMGCFQRWTRTYALHGSPLTRLAITCWKTSCCVDFELLRPLTPLARSDSMDDPTFLAPAFSVDPDLSYLTLSFGLGSACEPYPGGHWPTPLTGRARDGLPKRAFVPLVLYKQGAALAVAPGDHWLTSPLTGHGSGAARGLHGSVDALPAGWRARTWFTVGHDTHGALSCLGDRLQAGVKERRPSSAHEVNRGLGWWNAYGSHHTELLNPLNARELRRLLASTRAQGVPLHHLGLDLWYPYSRIGQAMAFIPDKNKYPRGLREPTEGLPLVLHLSALSEKNAYSASGSDPGFYETVAEELASHGAIAAWHDWLRTQQHTTDTLRSDPARAESWFAGMARAFGARGLDVILCMQTMGMVLASTQLPAVISARTSTDYLFCQQEALRRAASKGHEDLLEAWVPPAQLRKTNLLLGSVVHALGLTPFHDLFLSRADTRLGGGSPREEAVLRALSCGPVALGDGPGMLDVVLLQSLIGNNGAILRPDHPPIAVDTCLEGDIALFWTRHSQPLATWWYLVALNMADEPISLSARPPEDGEFFSWDGLTGSPITEGHTQLDAGGLAYRVFALFPAVFVLGTSFNPSQSILAARIVPPNPTLDNYHTLLTDSGFPYWIRNTILVAGSTGILSVLLCALGAYAFSRFRFSGRRPALLTMLLVQMFPQTLAMVAIYLLLFRLGGYIPWIGLNTHPGLILVYLGGAMGFNTWFMKGYFDTIPRSLEESAMVDGASTFQAFWRIVLPLARPILAVVFVIQFITVYSEYLLASVLLQGERMYTLAVGLNLYIGESFRSRWGSFAAAAVLGALLIMGVFYALQSQIVSGLTRGGVKE